MTAPALFGRAPELDQLRGALDQAIAGRGQLVVVSGEAGIGKSALADAVLDQAAAAGVAASYGRAWEFADAPPYFPLRAALRSIAVDPDAERDNPFALWDHALEQLALRAGERPRLWVVDDAHAADVGTLDLLAFLARPLRSLAALVVVTRRDRDPRLGPAAEQRLVRMARDGAALALAPLAAADVARLAARAAGRELSPGACAQLVERTGGNPLFVVECARSLAHDDGAALPATLRQVVHDRIALLPAATRDVLVAAAVLGRELVVAAIAMVVELPAADVIERLGAAIASGVIVETAPGALAFGHAIVRDAIEDAAPPARRAELHHRAQAALAALASTPAVVVERARHALAALDVARDPDTAGVVAAAIEYLAERSAFDRAFGFAQRLDQARQRGQLPAASPAERLRVAELAIAAGRGAEARRICGELIGDARERRDAGELARAVLVLASDLRPAVVDHALVALLEEALAGIADRDPALQCRVEARLAAARQPAPDPAQPIALAEQAIARARTLGDPRLICEVIDVGAAALVDMAPLPRRRALADEALDLAIATGDRPRRLRARIRRAMDLAESGEFAGFSREVDQLLDESLELGVPRHRWRPLLLASMRALADGRRDDSDRALAELAQLAAMIDDPALQVSLNAHAGTRAMQLHDHEQLRVGLARLPDVTGTMPLGRAIAGAVRAQYFALIGDAAATARELAAIEPGAAMLEHTNLRSLLVTSYALAGTEVQRRRLRELLRALPTPELLGGHTAVTYEGPVTRAIGLLDAALGDTAAGAEQLRASLALAERRGHRLWVAQIGFELGALVGDAGLLDRTAELAAELAMPGLVERIAAHRAQPAPAAPPPPGPRAAPPAFVLDREGDVWRVTGGSQPVRIKHSRGIELLARLVARPGDEIHVLALASDEPGAELRDAGAPAIDPQARRRYQQRLTELDDELEVAEARGDHARCAALERAREQLAAEVARAVGLGGQVRRAGSISERARINVQRRIRGAIERIAEADPALGKYVETAVRTGTYCCFRP